MTETSSAARQALRWSLMLTAVVFAGWLLLACPAWWMSGHSGLMGLTLAATLCLIPGWLVFALHSQYGTAAPVAVFIFATAGRMVLVLVGALAVKRGFPELELLSFALYLGAFYVLALAVEVKLLLKPLLRGTTSED